MTTIAIEQASPARFEDIEHAFDNGGDGRSCQCQWWTLTNRAFNDGTQDERAELLREQTSESPSPGLIAYVDGEAAGWVRVGPRTNQPRLARTKAYADATDFAWDDPSVWAISCFVIRREHRGRGIATSLLDAAVEHARSHGASAVEGYPVDVAQAPKSHSTPNALYHGSLTMFERAGFTVTGRTKPGNPVVARTL